MSTTKRMGRPRVHALEPAASILTELGGHHAVAERLGLHPNSVARWRMPVPIGTGGTIPADRVAQILRLAREKGIALDWETVAGQRH